MYLHWLHALCGRPCLAACPTGAVWRDQETGLVQADSLWSRVFGEEL